MQRYRHAPLLPLGLGMLMVAGGCSVPTQRDNLDATSRLVAGQVHGPLEWRLDPQADAQAMQRVDGLLLDGLTLDESIRVAYLASPDLQLALEPVEISRAEFVAAATASNPVLILGNREPGGALADFYPERTISLGIVQSVIDLLRIPGRRKVAKHDLERARLTAADSAVRIAAQVAQAWIDYSAALQILELRERMVAAMQERHNELLDAEEEEDADEFTDVLETLRGELLEQKGEAIRARLVMARARVVLGERLGITGWRDDWVVVQTLPALPDADPDPVAEEQAAMERRLDLLAGSKAVEARLHVLANHRRFRWLSQLDIGLFRDQATGGATFTGPSLAIELPVFNRRLADLLDADSRLRSEMRNLQAGRIAARGEIRKYGAEMTAARQLLQQIEAGIRPELRELQADAAAGDTDIADWLGLQTFALKTEVDTVDLLRDYWRARSALALASGDWGALSGLR